jgi:hypothetical protein
MLNLVVQFIMIYIMVLIWKWPNISTLGTPSAREDDATWWLTWGAVAVGVLHYSGTMRTKVPLTLDNDGIGAAMELHGGIARRLDDGNYRGSGVGVTTGIHEWRHFFRETPKWCTHI